MLAFASLQQRQPRRSIAGHEGEVGRVLRFPGRVPVRLEVPLERLHGAGRGGGAAHRIRRLPERESVRGQRRRVRRVGGDDGCGATGLHPALRGGARRAAASPACYVDPSLCAHRRLTVVRKQYMRAVDACLTVSCPDLMACIDAAIEPLNCF